MPSWTDKEDRQYQDIKKSAENRGADEKRAKELAARTVNKQRRQRGETPNKRSRGTGNPNFNLESRSKTELINIAKERGIKGYSRMKKEDLVKALEKK